MIASVAGVIVRLSVFGGELTAGIAESVAVTVMLPLKVAAGVPVIWLPFTLKVEGRPVAENVYGPVPPVAASGAVYGLPTVPFGSGEPVVTVTGGALIVRLSVFGSELA